ncbi:hypothetical protein, partial [Actinotalea sp. C106]|uniref:hypothetical protein n=1 Tax=Actinotalea sp. C106 TaxID=2908644 RepID=UPI00202877E9
QRALAADAEGTGLAEIHAELGATLGLTAADQERLAELEMATEADLLHPVPAVLPRLREARKAAGRVVFVSDMYLPAEFITEQLRQHGAWCEGDVLYVSHAHRTSKRSGTLFATVAAGEGVRPQDLRHYGNDDDADVRAARRAGAQGVLLPEGNPGRFELLLQRHRESTDGLSAAMAGASRLARLDVRAWTSRERALIEVAAGVLAPVLTSHLAAELRHVKAAQAAELTFTDDAPGRTLMRLAVRLGPDLPLRIEPGTRLDDAGMPRGRRPVVELCAAGLG